MINTGAHCRGASTTLSCKRANLDAVCTMVHNGVSLAGQIADENSI